MLTFIIVIHLMIVLAMCGLVLLQKSEGGGLGMGSGGGFMSSRGSTNVLTRSTAVLAACFFATSLLLSVIAGWNRNPGSILRDAGFRAGFDAGRAGAQGAGWQPARPAQRAGAGPVRAASAAIEVTVTFKGPGNRPFDFVGCRGRLVGCHAGKE